MSVILASGSPRRRELMELIGFKDIRVIPAVREENAPAGLAPDALVETLANAKAAEVAEVCLPDDVIVAADTIVWHNGTLYGKPHSAAQAEAMLTELSGQSHFVYTGVTVRRGDTLLTGHEVTKVCFRPIDRDEILAYIATGEPMDKAGAYGAQGRGAIFVQRIEGDFFNVMGLPLCLLSGMLKTMGVVVL